MRPRIAKRSKVDLFVSAYVGTFSLRLGAAPIFSAPNLNLKDSENCSTSSCATLAELRGCSINAPPSPPPRELQMLEDV